MTQRLLDLGYRVTAVDLDDVTWQCRAVKPLLLDLNRNGWPAALPSEGWDAIVALELIEHLDAPRKFVQELAGVAPPGALCVLSTPNVTGARSLLRAAVKDAFYCFGRKEYFATGHVSIVPWWLLCCMAEEERLPGSQRNSCRWSGRSAVTPTRETR
jgi:SAM-dependent methyltransferase